MKTFAATDDQARTIAGLPVGGVIVSESLSEFIENLDPLPHMNRVMTWGPNGYFATYEDMKKAERAIRSALDGFAKEIQQRYRQEIEGV